MLLEYTHSIPKFNDIRCYCKVTLTPVDFRTPPLKAVRNLILKRTTYKEF